MSMKPFLNLKKKEIRRALFYVFFSYIISPFKKPRATNHRWEGSVVGIAQGRCQMDPHLFVGSMVQVPKMRNLLIAVLVNLKALFNFDNFKRIQARIITRANQSNFRLFSAVKKGTASQIEFPGKRVAMTYLWGPFFGGHSRLSISCRFNTTQKNSSQSSRNFDGQVTGCPARA